MTEMNRASASTTIDDANVTYFMTPVRGSNSHEQPDHTGLYQSDETEQASIYDEYKEFTEPTVCTEDCKLEKSPRTISDYEAAIKHDLLCLQTHKEAKGAAIWTQKELDEDGKRQKKKPYQKEEPKVIEGAKAAAATYCRQFFEDYPPLYTTAPIPEQRMLVIREKEYDNVRQHGPALIAMGSHMDQVSSALKTEARAGLWENLSSLPEERDYALFDSYISLIRLVAQYAKNQKEREKMDELLEKLYDELSKLLGDLKERIPPESELYRLLSTRDQFWPSIRSLSSDPIIDELKEVIVGKVGTLNLADKEQIENSKASVLSRCKDKMFQNCFKVFYGHGKKLKDLINKLLILKEEEVEPQVKRNRRDEQCHKEILSEARSNLKTFTRSEQPTLMVEDILDELGKQLSSCSNLVPLTYGQLNKALGKDIRPILREFLMDPRQTVENTVRELVQLSNNQFFQSRTLDTTVLLVALREPIVWRTIIFDWLAERRMYFSAAMPVATMEEPQDEDLQITSYDDGSICKMTDTSTANVCCLELEEENDDDYLQCYPSNSQLHNPVSSINPTVSTLPANEWEKLSGNVNLDPYTKDYDPPINWLSIYLRPSSNGDANNSTIPPSTSCSNGTTSPLTTEELDALMNWCPDLPPSGTGDATVWPNKLQFWEVYHPIQTVTITRTPRSNLKTRSEQPTLMFLENIPEGIDVETMKKKIFSDLSLLLVGSDLVSGHGVVRLLFSLCRHANQSSVQVRKYFTVNEQTELDAQLIEAIPHFHRNVREKALMLGEESLMRLRTVRSGIQFLNDDLATTDSPDLYFAVLDFMESPAVFELDKKLRIFEGMRGQYDCGDDCEDLRGVPDSHFWWSELERGDSERKFVE